MIQAHVASWFVAPPLASCLNLIPKGPVRSPAQSKSQRFCFSAPFAGPWKKAEILLCFARVLLDKTELPSDRGSCGLPESTVTELEDEEEVELRLDDELVEDTDADRFWRQVLSVRGGSAAGQQDSRLARESALGGGATAQRGSMVARELAHELAALTMMLGCKAASCVRWTSSRNSFRQCSISAFARVLVPEVFLQHRFSAPRSSFGKSVRFSNFAVTWISCNALRTVHKPSSSSSGTDLSRCTCSCAKRYNLASAAILRACERAKTDPRRSQARLAALAFAFFALLSHLPSRPCRLRARTARLLRVLADSLRLRPLIAGMVSGA